MPNIDTTLVYRMRCRRRTVKRCKEARESSAPGAKGRHRMAASIQPAAGSGPLHSPITPRASGCARASTHLTVGHGGKVERVRRDPKLPPGHHGGHKLLLHLCEILAACNRETTARRGPTATTACAKLHMRRGQPRTAHGRHATECIGA